MKNEFLSKTGKLIKSFLFLLLFAVCFSSAEGAQAEELVIGNVTAHENSISVPIIAGSDFTGITSMTLFVDYDENLLSYQDYTLDQLSLPVSMINENPTGKVNVLWYCLYTPDPMTESFSEGDVLMYLNFEVITNDSTITKMTFSSLPTSPEVNHSGGVTVFTDGTVILNPEPLIINHQNIDLNQVPAEWIEAAKADYQMSYGHTSHGSQIVSGMNVIKGAPGSLYWFDHNGTDGGLSLHDGTPSGDLGNPDRTTWEARTRTMLEDPGNNRNIVMWSWCGQADTTEASMQIYLDLMNGLEADYPEVSFIYMTGHLNGTGAAGNLNQRNEQIRNYCLTNGKTLFDFADIESYDPDGDTNFMELYATDNCNYTGGNWADEWCAANPGECSSCGCSHSRSLNCDMKGRAFWWMMARLAGWDGNVADPLVAHWKLDEESGTVASDSSVYGNDGTVLNGASWTTGIIDGALNFDGNNDFVEVPSSPSLNITEEITVIAWVNETEQGQYSKILAKRNGHYYFYFIGSANGQLYAGIGDGEELEHHSLFGMTNKETTLGTGWHHVAFTFTNDGNLIKLYKDGALTEYENLDQGLVPFEGLIGIGANDLPGWQSNFGGDIDDVKIYNYALSASEIASEYEEGIVPDVTPPVITLLENSPMDIEFNSVYLDAGATAFDDFDGDITENIVTVNLVNTAALGTYTVTYNVSDTAGNPAEPVVRIVNVVETPAGDSLVAYWKFDEGTGAIANDSSTYGNHGAIVNGTSWTTDKDGQTGEALNFDGDDDLMEVPDSGSLNVTEEITVMAWVNETIPGPYSKIVSKRNGDYFYFIGSYQGQLYAGIGDGPVSHHSLFGMTDKETTLGTGWHHVAFTFNNTDHTIRLYKDGVNTGEDEPLTQSLVSFNGYVQIGANRFANEIITWPSNFGGDIDEVKIYNRVLSDVEIATAAGAFVPMSGGSSHIPVYLEEGLEEGRVLGVTTAENIFDGDIIRNPNAEGDAQFDVYIVKTINNKKFKRLILSPHVFESYGHLDWNNIKLVNQDTMDSFALSNLVRCFDPGNNVDDPKVYSLTPNGDTGTKSHLNLTITEFEITYDWDAIYTINEVDRDAYIIG